MWKRFIIGIKISLLSNKIKSMEDTIFRYRRDMTLVNDLYYCGRGDVDDYIEQWSSDMFRKILACERLKLRLEKRLSGVVGTEGKNF